MKYSKIIFRAHIEKEFQSLNKKYVAKDEEYSMASEGLEKELCSLKHKYSVLSKEKLKLTKDKESLLEEVILSIHCILRCLDISVLNREWGCLFTLTIIMDFECKQSSYHIFGLQNQSTSSSDAWFMCQNTAT